MRPNERNEIIRRLITSEGHLHSIIGMVEAGQPCEQVLHQLQAVQAALRATLACFLTYQVEQCQEIINQSKCPEEQMGELAKLHDLFSSLT